MYTLDQALKLTQKDVRKHYQSHINPALLSVFRILGFDKIDIQSAKGSYINLRCGRRILDCTAGLGVLNFGHNNSKILEAEKKYRDHNGIDILKFGPHPLQSALAYNLAQLLPGELDTCFFTTSGAESVEAAIKLVTRVQPKHRDIFIRMKDGYHGKTHGALSLTDASNYGQGFHVGIDPSKVKTIAFNDMDALNEIISKYGSRINSVITEPIQGQTLAVPDENYLNEVIKQCHKNDILVIFDEIKSGMGRSGKFLASNYDGAIPDVITLSKSLGGGIRAIGAMVTTSRLNRLAYGKTKNSTLHTSTFQGIGSSCAVAIQALNMISDKNFLDEMHMSSSYLNTRLNELKNKYPTIIKTVVGKGMMLGLELSFSKLVEKVILKREFSIIKDIKVILMGSLIRKIFKEQDVMLSFSAISPELMYILPPLNVSKKEIDSLINALDIVFSQGLTSSLSKFVTGNLSDIASAK